MKLKKYLDKGFLMCYYLYSKKIKNMEEKIMRTISTNVYRFEELSTIAKEKAIESFRCSEFFQFYNDEIIDTIKEIARAISCDYDYYSYDGIDYEVSFTSHDNVESISGKRAYAYIVNNYLMPNKEYKTYWKDHCIYTDGRKNLKRRSKLFYSWDNCPFTGYIADCCFIEAWRAWEKSFNCYSTIESFLDLLGEKLGKEWTSENEYQNSDEYIEDYLMNNNYEFLEDGTEF